MKTKEEQKEWYHQRYLRNREAIIKRNSEYKKRNRARYAELERERRAKDPEKYRAYWNDYARKHVLYSKRGNCITVAVKRLYPEDGCCEICRKQRQLVYHHWDDEKPELGMWICRGCHFKAEDIERGWFILYLALKEEINKGGKENDLCQGSPKFPSNLPEQRDCNHYF